MDFRVFRDGLLRLLRVAANAISLICSPSQKLQRINSPVPDSALKR
jgi:hypothetical protein